MHTEMHRDHHKFANYLPRNGGETALFILVISLISVNLIAPLITFMEIGFSLENYQNVLRVLPFIWLVVVALVLTLGRLAGQLKSKIIHPQDSFNAHIIMETLLSVLLMSIVLTVVGTWIGSRTFSAYPIQHFFQMWFRNFAIAFAIETLIAGPVGRLVMGAIHAAQESRAMVPEPVYE